MRLQNKSLDFVVNFLLGVAWATLFVGMISTFLSYYSESLLYAMIFGLFASLPGLIGILLLEYIITSRESYIQLQKQTHLLEQLLHKEDR
ncbi:MAG: hypothetical protein Q9M36_15970 [Sulfurovum sp.]|nr:hypothetical protein [Sulfurovum sp.]